MQKREQEKNMERVTPTKPQISEETIKEMAKFFAKTSIPRILAEKAKEQNKNLKTK